MGPLSDLSAVEGAWHEVTYTRQRALFYTHADDFTAEVILSFTRRLRLIVRSPGVCFHTKTIMCALI